MSVDQSALATPARLRAESLLLGIFEGISAQTGDAFLRALVKNLAAALDVRYAFIGVFVEPARDRARILAFWNGAGYEEPFEYPLAGTPCSIASSERECMVREHAQKAFPGDPDLGRLGAQSYFGLRLHSTDGAPIGLLSVMDVKPLGDEATVRAVLHVFAARAGAELERLRANTLKSESERRFRDLVELSADWYWEQDENFRFTSTQAGVVGTESLQAAVEGAGKTRWELHAGRLTEEQWAAHRRQLEAHAEFHDLEFERPSRDGQMRWVSISGRPVFDDEGVFRGYRGIGRDITARKLAEEASRESEARFRAMAELASDFYWEQDENLRFTKRVGMVWETQAYPRESTLGKTRWELPALNMSEADWSSHRADLEAHREFRELEIERPLPSGETRWISTSGRPIFDASGRFRGYRGVGQDITARKRSQSALREHERVRSALMRNLPGMVYRCANDSQWTVELASEGCTALTGYAPEDFIGNRTLAYADIIHDEDRDQVWSDVQAALAGRQPFELQYRIRTRDGAEKWVWERGAGVYAPAGELLALEGYVTDVTSRVRSEQAAHEGIERLRLMADNVPAMIVYSDAGHRFQYANRQFVDFYVGKPDSIVGKPMAEVLGAAAFASVRPGVERALGGETANYTAERRRADGALRHIEVSLVPHRGDEGRVLGVYTFIRDVTQSHLAETEVREAEQQFRVVADNVPAMICYVDRDYRYRYANRNYVEFYGDGRPIDGRTVAEFVGEAAWRAARPGIDRALAGEAADYTRIHRRRSGKERFVDVSMIPHFGEAGRVLGVYVMILDVTQRRRAEEALRLRNRALESSVNAVMITRPAADGFRSVYVNPAFERMTGYTAAETIGRSPRFLHGDDSGQPGLEALRVALREEREGTARIRNYRKDGTMFWLEVRIAPVRDEEARVTHFVSAGSDVTDQVRYEAEIERHANYDSLTGLPNRNLLNDRLAQAIVKSERVKLPVGVLYLDLDHLKRINDSLGHAVGDRVIAAVGERLAGAVRTGDTVARMGGDEFVILLADLKREEDAATVVSKLLNSVGTPMKIDAHEFVLTASIGVAIYAKDGADAATLLRNADAALYRAKEQGRDGFRFFAAEMNERVVRFMRIEEDMRKALEVGEFWLQYQPIVRLATGKPVGCEALVRWRRPDGSVIPPADFIPVAEESGLIVPLGRWIFESATRQAARWNKARRKPLYVSINLSARQFRDPKLVDTVRDALAAAKVEPALIKLEITESAVMQNVEQAGRSLRALKALGVQLAVDDFGTGYSSLAYLKSFPIDTLKIDRSFVRDLPGDADDLAISRAVIDLARGLGMDAVAEGVETRAQADVLELNGCEFAQGYLFGRPEDPQKLGFRARRG